MKNILVSVACVEPYYISSMSPVVSYACTDEYNATKVLSCWEVGLHPIIEIPEQLSANEIYQILHAKITKKIFSIRQTDEDDLKASMRSNFERLKQGIAMGFETYLKATVDVIKRCLETPNDFGSFEFSISLHRNGLPVGAPLLAAMFSTDSHLIHSEGQIRTLTGDDMKTTKCTLQVFENGMVYDDGQLYSYIEEAVHARIEKAHLELIQ